MLTKSNDFVENMAWKVKFYPILPKYLIKKRKNIVSVIKIKL